MFTSLAVSPLAPTALHAAGWGFHWFFLFVPLLWIALVVLIIVLVGRRWRHARWAGPDYEHAYPAAAAERTLAERYAHGDIDEAEYRARLEVLRANRH